MVVETQLDHTAREVAEATGQPETDSTLMEFGACAVALRSILYQDRQLADTEIRFMENHFQILEMAYLRWKRKHEIVGH
jgi:hypothetical protein